MLQIPRIDLDRISSSASSCSPLSDNQEVQLARSTGDIYDLWSNKDFDSKNVGAFYDRMSPESYDQFNDDINFSDPKVISETVVEYLEMYGFDRD